jgi:hypothetical protein
MGNPKDENGHSILINILFVFVFISVVMSGLSLTILIKTKPQKLSDDHLIIPKSSILIDTVKNVQFPDPTETYVFIPVRCRVITFKETNKK